MPEGDTIHRTARALQPLVGDSLHVEAIHPRARACGVAERLDGRRLAGVEAYGKLLLLRFEGDLVLRSHLGMTGSWRVLDASAAVAGKPWLVLRGARHQAVLRGGARLGFGGTPAPLGPDVLAARPDYSRMVANIRTTDSQRGVGDVLLDQRVVAGIGNIWRSEALWGARLDPFLPVGDATDDELTATLVNAAELMRSSVDGQRPRLRVYRRTGRPCYRCGAAILARRQGDAARLAYWCPACQRGKAGADA